LYEDIITRFGCPTHLVYDQESHFINRNIEIITQEFMITHHKSTTYYPQRNGQAESTNKTLGMILAKIVNAN
jgi:transposase InsO family protein